MNINLSQSMAIYVTRQTLKNSAILLENILVIFIISSISISIVIVV